MSWKPSTTVTIEGVDFTGDTVGTVNIQRGRDDVYSDPVAGYATINLIDKDGTGFDIDLTTKVRVSVADSSAAPVRIFTGLVTDVERQLYDPGLAGDPAAIVTITAVGPLARMSRRQIFEGGRSPETDGDRILEAISAGVGIAWEEAQGTWSGQPSDLTWDDFDPFDSSLIAPGLFDLAALPPREGGYSAYQAASFASFSGEGILYETGSGDVGWDNADSRSSSVAYTVIEADWLTAQALRTSSSLSDIVNRLELVYDGGVVQTDDPDSVGLFGRYDRRIETDLANLSNANARAERFLDRHAFPLDNLDKVGIRIDGLDDADADSLLAIDINSPVVLVDLPDTLRVNQLPGFVEGIQISLDPYRYTLTLSVSDAQLSIGAIRWTQVPPTLEWDDVNATLTWQDARSF
jgi:hypothetical protein